MACGVKITNFGITCQPSVPALALQSCADLAGALFISCIFKKENIIICLTGLL